MIPIWQGKVNQGMGDLHIEYDQAYSLMKYLRGLEQQRVEVIIRKPKTKRSDLQNNYYWGVVLEILSKELGYDQDELHEILKYKFLKIESTLGMEYIRSTTKLTTGEFEEYLEKIKRWAAEFLGINIPNPNEAE